MRKSLEKFLLIAPAATALFAATALGASAHHTAAGRHHIAEGRSRMAMARHHMAMGRKM